MRKRSKLDLGLAASKIEVRMNFPSFLIIYISIQLTIVQI